MSIASELSRNDYVGNNTASTYSYTFGVQNEDHVRVVVCDPTGAETVLSKATHYTVTGVRNAGGGTVVLVGVDDPDTETQYAWLDEDGNLSAEYTLVLRRVRPLKQQTSIRNQGRFYPETHELQFDALVEIDQQQQDQINRSVKLPESLTSNDFDPTLPFEIAGMNGRTLVTNPAGDGFALGPSVSLVNSIPALAASANAAALAASNSEAAALASETSATASAASATSSEAAAAVSAAAAIYAAENATGIPSGGTTGQVPAKASNADYDVAWVTPVVQADIDLHVNDTTGAHAASSIAVTPAGNLTSTNAQSALTELQTDVDALATNVSTHTSASSGAHAGSAISNTPSGNLSATTVQGALNELQTDIDTRATSSALAAHEADTTAIHGIADTAALATKAGAETLTNKTMGDAVAFTEVVTPALPSAGVRKLYPKSDGKFYMLDSSGAEVPVGSGSAGTFAKWVESANAPVAMVSYDNQVYSFTQDLAQALYAWVKVPSSYVAGTQCKIIVPFYTSEPSTSLNVKIQVTTYLVRSYIDSVASPTFSNNTTASTSLSGAMYMHYGTYNLTDSSGRIGGQPVQPNDTLKIALFRGTGDTSTYDLMIPAHSAEVKFA